MTQPCCTLLRRGCRARGMAPPWRGRGRWRVERTLRPKSPMLRRLRPTTLTSTIPVRPFFSGAPTVPTPSVDLSVANQRTVSVNAHVTFPGLLLGYMTGATTVQTSAQVVRKDVNVMMVLDRSHSMALSSSCAPMIAAAQEFVDQFASGRDNVGLITFAELHLSQFLRFPTPSTQPARIFKRSSVTSIVTGQPAARRLCRSRINS